MATPELLGMPREILDRILRDSLVTGIIARKASHPAFAKPKSAVPLLRTCKILYEAGLPIFYGENVFYFSEFHELASWIGKQRVYNKGMVRHVLVGDNTGAGKDRVRAWVALPGLKSYNILGSGLAGVPEMPRVMFMRRMWKREQQASIDIGVVVCADWDRTVFNTDLSGAEMKLYNVVAKGMRRKSLVFEFGLDKHYAADEMHYTLLERRCRRTFLLTARRSQLPLLHTSMVTL
ncbi:hypothetical protein Vi05172_g9665 [Venturia inaequalis]|nr:hypothetical protein Vi05172_g9665 [Venturia inaequalis]